jgi:hypothetical protein
MAGQKAAQASWGNPGGNSSTSDGSRPSVTCRLGGKLRIWGAGPRQASGNEHLIAADDHSNITAHTEGDSRKCADPKSYALDRLQHQPLCIRIHVNHWHCAAELKLRNELEEERRRGLAFVDQLVLLRLRELRAE